MKKRPDQIWEPITPNQLYWMENNGRDGTSLPWGYEPALPDPEDVTALSKQEASFIIERFIEGVKWPKPAKPQTMEQLIRRWDGQVTPGTLEKKKAEWAKLPTVAQVAAIRRDLRRLGWKRNRYAPLMKRQAKVGEFRSLTRETARAFMIGITKAMMARN